jgi:hypothetical protein
MRSLSILRLAARAPRRSGPVTSTLGRTFNPGRLQFVALLQQPSGSSASLGKSSPPMHVVVCALPGSSARFAGCGIAVGKFVSLLPGRPCPKQSPLGVAAFSEIQFHGRAARGQTGSHRQRRAGGAGSAASASTQLRQRQQPKSRHRHCSSSSVSPAYAHRCGLTGRSTGRATAWHPGRAAAFVYHRPHGRTARAPCRVAPVNSALGPTNVPAACLLPWQPSRPPGTHACRDRAPG